MDVLVFLRVFIYILIIVTVFIIIGLKLSSTFFSCDYTDYLNNHIYPEKPKKYKKEDEKEIKELDQNFFNEMVKLTTIENKLEDMENKLQDINNILSVLKNNKQENVKKEFEIVDS